MLRNYIIKSSPITVFFPDDAWDFFTPGKDIDAIDLAILHHIHTLPAFLTRTSDGPSQLIVEEHDGKLFFEFAWDEFFNCYPLFDIKNNDLSIDRLDRLVKNGLLLSVKSQEFDEEIYRTSELYEELFVC